MTRIRLSILPAVACALVACGRNESPFIDGAPPMEVQEQFLAACQQRIDERRQDIADQSMVGSDMPGPGQPRPASMCRVYLYWQSNKITALSVEVFNDGPLLDRFVRTSVLPLLKPQAQAVVTAELLDHIGKGPRARTRRKVLGGGVRTVIELNVVDRHSFAFGELFISR